MNLHELIHRYENGIASQEEVLELNHLLLDDKASQEDFLLHAEIDTHLRLEARSASGAGQDPTSIKEESVVQSARRWSQKRIFRLASWAVAAIGLFLVLGQSLLIKSVDEQTITVTSLSGPVSWTGDKGQVTSDLSVGHQLTGGTMELLAPSSLVEFSFEDKSVVTLAGLSAVTITSVQDSSASTQQKELHLRHGRLSATVKEQPKGQPMVVRTPSAEMTVLGTRFDVQSALDATRLTVNEGRVHLKRLLDGEEVEVPARQSVFASLENEDDLSLQTRDSSVGNWFSDLRNDVEMGKWVPSLWKIALDLKKAVANQAMTVKEADSIYKEAANFDDSSGSLWAVPSKFGAIIVLSPQKASEQPIHLNSTSQLVVHGRAFLEDSMQIGIGVNEPSGGFAGKFTTEVRADQISGQKEFTLQIPISSFHDKARPDRSPVGFELSNLWCLVKRSTAKFQITRVELHDAPSGKE